MNISMTGIDHSRAPVDVRSRFALTRNAAGEAMEKLKKEEQVEGCLILSTCNRLEIWITYREEEIDLFSWICRVKDIPEEERESLKSLFVKRQDREAVEHLFTLTAGLKSQILGEDQILAQVKDALSLAREHYAADSVLEVLFRMAVTAGKRIKTEVPLSHGNPSVIDSAIAFLESRGEPVKGKTCMVIGNGEMGKTAALSLRAAGADVTVTVRQYRSGVVEIPAGCERINYGDRMEFLPRCDLVVSATASPNFTLREELFEGLELKKPLTIIDLALPRDVEPALGNKPGITLYDLDSFTSDPGEFSQDLSAANKIVEEQMEEFYSWLSGRDMIPRIFKIRDQAVEDVNLRIHKTLRSVSLSEQEREVLLRSLDESFGKVVGKLIFGLRDHLDPDAFGAAVEGLEKLYEE